MKARKTFLNMKSYTNIALIYTLIGLSSQVEADSIQSSYQEIENSWLGGSLTFGCGEEVYKLEKTLFGGKSLKVKNKLQFDLIPYASFHDLGVSNFSAEIKYTPKPNDYRYTDFEVNTMSKNIIAAVIENDVFRLKKTPVTISVLPREVNVTILAELDFHESVIRGNNFYPITLRIIPNRTLKETTDILRNAYMWGTRQDEFWSSTLFEIDRVELDASATKKKFKTWSECTIAETVKYDSEWKNKENHTYSVKMKNLFVAHQCNVEFMDFLNDLKSAIASNNTKVWDELETDNISAKIAENGVAFTRGCHLK